MSCRRAGCAIVAVLALAGLSGCGGPGESTVVVRVGNEKITKAMVDHWTSVVRRGGAFTGFRGKPPRGTPRQRVLVLLISSAWLLGEAARERLPIPEEAIDRALDERAQGGGESKLRKHLSATGQTVAGLRRELSAELAVEAIHRELERQASQVTEPEIAAYYRRNRRQLAVPAARAVDLIEQLWSPSVAEALVRRIGAGRRFAQMSRYHEVVTHADGGSPEKARLVNAIFAARIGAASRPYQLFKVWPHSWVVFVVRKKIPARPQPLSKVRGQVLEHLEDRPSARYRDRVRPRIQRAVDIRDEL